MQNCSKIYWTLRAYGEAHSEHDANQALLRTSMPGSWLHLWSSGQSSWLQIQRSGLDYRRCQIFWEAVGLEWCPLSLVSITKELLGRDSSGSGLQSREYGRRFSSRWPRGALHPQKLALTSPTNGGLSVGIVRSRTQAMGFSFVFLSTHLKFIDIRHRKIGFTSCDQYLLEHRCVCTAY
jgi:hypothetical protein